MKSTIAVLACVLAGAASLQAQTPARPAAGQAPAAAVGEVRGTVIDGETKAPVQSGSVAVWSKADNTLVAGGMTRPDGTFRIDGLTPGTYYLKVTMIGFDTHTTGELVISPAAPRAIAGSIALVRSPIVMQGIEANAERTVVIAPDRNSYRVRDLAPAATTATDVLETVPSVHVDPDGKLSLRGNENVVVQINGRPTPMRGTQLIGYLRQLPANTIDRIEVIPNPSAKQDPEGMAGILNIVMKQNVDLGRSGGLNFGASTQNQYMAGGNVGYQAGRVTMLFTYGYNSDERRIYGVNDRTRLGALRAPQSFTEQDIDGTATNRGHNINATLDYRVGPRTVLFTSWLANRRSTGDASLSAYSELNGTRTMLARYDRERDAAVENWLGDGTLGFRHTFVPQKHELSGEVRFSRQDNEEGSELWRQPIGSTTPNPIDLETNAIDAGTNQLTVQTDYVRAFGKASKLEAGYKASARWLDRAYLVRKDVLGTGNWVDSDLSNTLAFDETVNAAYAVLSHGAGGAVELQAGLRAEHASRDFSLAGGDSYPHSYNSLFPSALVSYKLNDRTVTRLSYSRRIRRPNTEELNPFPAFFDLQNVMIGNPALGPEYTDAIEASVQRSGKLGTLQISPFFRHTSDIIRVDVNTADTVAGREVTSVSFRNLDTSNSWGADVNGTVRLGQNFSGLAGFNVFKIVTDGGSESSLSSDALSWTARMNGAYTVRPGTVVQLNYFYRAPVNIEKGRFASQSGANISVRQNLTSRAVATLRLADPFKTNRFRVEVGNDEVIQFTHREFSSRALFLNLQYNIGQAPRVRQRVEEQPQPQTGFPRGGG
jgi:outer membrane receptor protein involved in Fe transport